MPDRDLAEILALVAKLEPALGRHDRSGLVQVVDRLVTLCAPLGNQWERLAHIVAAHGELVLARRAIDLFVEANGTSPRAVYRKFDFLSQIGALEEAQALLETLPEDVPDRATHAYSRGAMALFLGRPKDARAWLERALWLKPELGQAWLPLATATDFANEPELSERIIAAEAQMQRAHPAVGAVYYYALGKAYADRGETTLAFNAFARGAQLKKMTVRYDRQLDRANAAESVRGYTAKRIADIARQQSEPTGRAIFVTGLPRSGTSLVTQILTSHSAVSDGAEANLLHLLRQENGGMDYPSLKRAAERRETAWAAQLWDRLLHERFPTPGRVVDKSTDAGYLFGLAAALLPDAPMIWLTRDPLDNAWSCFRTHFFGGLEWSYDLDDIAFHFRLVDQLLSQWQDILGERLLVVPLEALTAEPDTWTRRLLAHCGLSEEAAPFAPHENRMPVTTSSLMQVRRPVNRQGIGAAEPYRQFLEPFLDAYYA